MTDKERIIDKLYGAVAGLFLVYGISTEEGVGKIVIDLLNEAENQFQFKEQECDELRMKFCSECGERDDDNIPCKMIRDLDYYLQKEQEDNDRYRKALDEIEEMAKTCLYQDVCVLCSYSDKCENPYDVLVYEPSRGILDIINKAKEEE